MLIGMTTWLRYLNREYRLGNCNPQEDVVPVDKTATTIASSLLISSGQIFHQTDLWFHTLHFRCHLNRFMDLSKINVRSLMMRRACQWKWLGAHRGEVRCSVSSVFVASRIRLEF
jgi:hypothetical protein